MVARKVRPSAADCPFAGIKPSNGFDQRFSDRYKHLHEPNAGRVLMSDEEIHNRWEHHKTTMARFLGPKPVEFSDQWIKHGNATGGYCSVHQGRNPTPGIITLKYKRLSQLIDRLGVARDEIMQERQTFLTNNPGSANALSDGYAQYNFLSNEIKRLSRRIDTVTREVDKHRDGPA
jgi:hypothetical protein